MRAWINYGIEICTELRGIDPGGISCSIRDGRARHFRESLGLRSILTCRGGQPAAFRLIGVTFCAPLSMSSNSAVQVSSAARRSLR